VALGFAVAGLVAAGAIYLAGRARSPAGPPPDEAPAVALAPDVAASPDAAIPPDGAPAVPRVLLPDVAPAAPDDVPPAVPRVVLPDVAPVGPDVALAVPDVGVRPAPDVASIAEARSVAEAPFIAPAEPAPDAAPVPDLVPDRASPDAAPSPREVAAARDDAGRVDRAARPPRDAGEPAVPSGRAVLVVPRPEGVDVEIAVFVDGVRRGAAPVQVELDPGDHEVRFEAAGRHSLSVVHLAAGERKTLVPRQLIRELARPPD
jgi:hypothetical protein